MERGYIKLWRRLQFNNLWTSEKFTRGQAWVDLIMIANHKPGFIRKRGIKIELQRGDVGYSEVELSNRWKWSRGKVRRFLSELCSGNDPFLVKKTVQQNKFITSCYNIVKYNIYQGGDTADGQQTDSKRYRNKNDKNEKNNIYMAKTFLLRDGSTYTVPEKLYQEFKHTYPDIDIDEQLKKIKIWCLSNPEKRKTRRGASRFVNSWLSRAQDNVKEHVKPKPKITTKADIDKEVYGN